MVRNPARLVPVSSRQKPLPTDNELQRTPSSLDAMRSDHGDESEGMKDFVDGKLDRNDVGKPWLSGVLSHNPGRRTPVIWHPTTRYELKRKR